MKKTTFLDLQESAKSQLQKQKEEEEKRKIIAKNTNVRALTNLKINMDKRLQQRSLALYYWTNNKVQNALIIGKQLMFSSQKVWRQFNDQFAGQFQQQYFFRTSKAREHLQYLLDSVLLCRIFIAGKKREDAVDILEKLELPQAPIVKQQNISTNMDKILFNQAHQIYSKTCAALLSFIQITKQLRIHQYTEKMFSKYLAFVKLYYGKIQYGTALFKHGNYLYENKMYEEAENQYIKCIAIRKGNVYNGGLIDALVNSSICLRQMCDYQVAIQRMKSAIQINKDILNGEGSLDQYYLFLAKLYFESGDFKQAYNNFIITYKLRQNLQKGNPKRVQIQLNFMFFYKTLKDIGKNAQQFLNLTDKKQIQVKKILAEEVAEVMQKNILQRQDFAKYKQFKSSKMAHLTLTISKEFFEMLNSQQIFQLNSLIQRLTQLTFTRGKTQLSKCSFYKQKKTRDILLQTNAALKEDYKIKV